MPARHEILNMADALCRLETALETMAFDYEQARDEVIAALAAIDRYPPIPDEAQRLRTYTRSELVKRFDGLVKGHYGQSHV